MGFNQYYQRKQITRGRYNTKLFLLYYYYNIIIIINHTKEGSRQHTAKKPVSHREPNPGPCNYTPQDQLTDQRWNQKHKHANSLPLRDSGTMTTSITPCPGHRCFDEYTSRQLGPSRPTPLAGAILKRLTRTCDDGQHQKSGAYHFDSSSSTHLNPQNQR